MADVEQEFDGMENDAGQDDASFGENRSVKASTTADASLDDGVIPLRFRSVRVDLVAAINNDRRQAGLPPVEFDESLSRIADKHCDEMGNLVYVGHISKDGRAPYHRYFDAGCRDHIFENVGGSDAGDSEKYVVHENSLSSLVFESHASFMMAEPPGDLHRRNVLRNGVTHVGIGLYYSDKHFRLVEVFAARYIELLDKSPDGADAAPGFRLTTDETYIYAKCTVPGYGIVACVVFYEPHPSPMPVQDIDGVTVYEDGSPDRVAVVWPWEMERLANGVMHIPIFLNTLQPGLYYAQLLVCPTTKTIPYDGPNEDLDIAAPYIVPAAGLVYNCSKDVDTSAWSGLGSSMHDLDAEGLDMAVTGIEPFSEIVLAKGSEPVLLGFKRQTIMVSADASNDAIVVNVANAPGLPPVVGITLVTGDGDLSTLTIPEGFEVIEPNIADLLRESDGLRGMFGLPPVTAIGNDDEDAPVEPLSALAVNPKCVYVAVKRQEESSTVLGADDDEGKFGDDLLLDVGISLVLQSAPLPQIPDGYDQTVANVVISQGDAAESTAEMHTVEASLVLAWTAMPEAVGEVLAQRQADKREADLQSFKRDVVQLSDEPVASAKHQPKVSIAVDDHDVDGAVSIIGGGLDTHSSESHVVDLEAQATRKAQEKQKLAFLMREAEDERARLADENKDLQRKLAAYFVIRQAEEEKTAEQVGVGEGSVIGSLPGTSAGPAGAGTSSVGPVRSAEELEQSYLESLQQVVAEKKKIAAFLSRCDAQAMELQTRLDEKESRAQEIQKSFVEFKREIARAAENSRTGKPIPKRIIAQFEVTELAKDREVERVRLKNIHLKFQLKKLESKIKEKEQLADGLHLIDFEQLKIENQTLNEKIEDRNEELSKLRKKLTQTVQVLTHVREKLQFVDADAESQSTHLAGLASEVAQHRDTVARKKLSREKLRVENEKLKNQRGFVNNDALVLDFETRKKHIKELEGEIATLKDRFMFLSSQSKTGTLLSSKK